MHIQSWVCGRSRAGIAGSNSAGGLDACLLSFCVVQVDVFASGRSLVQWSHTDCGGMTWLLRCGKTNKQTACASYLPIESIYKLIYCSCLELKLVRIKLIARCANIRPDCEIFLH